MELGSAASALAASACHGEKANPFFLLHGRVVDNEAIPRLTEHEDWPGRAHRPTDRTNERTNERQKKAGDARSRRILRSQKVLPVAK